MKLRVPQWAVAVTTLVCVALGVLAGNISTLLQQPSYEATASVYVAARTSGSDTSSSYLGALLAKQRVVSYETVAKSLDVAQEALLVSQVPELSATDLADAVKAYSRTDSVVLEISVRDESPLRSSILANAVVDAFAAKVSVLESPDGSPQRSPVEIRTVARAVAPMDASSPNPTSNALMGAIFGLFAAIAIVRTAGSGRRRIQSVVDVEAVVDKPVVAVPQQVHERDAQGADHDRFQGTVNNLRLRIALGQKDYAEPSTRQIIAITPAGPDVPASTSIARQLASSSARAGLPTILVDLGSVDSDDEELPMALGLDEVLWGREELRGLLSRDTAQHFPYDLLLSGGQVGVPRYPLSSRRARSTIRDLLLNYKTVVLNVPDYGARDWHPLMQMSDAVVLVTQTNSTRLSEVIATAAALSEVGANLAGVVLVEADGKLECSMK